jgi:hypothetical protein
MGIVSLSPSLFLSLSLSHSLSLLSYSIPLIHRFSCAGLRLGVEQWNSVKNPPETKVSHREPFVRNRPVKTAKS